ncbi:MAG: hypothetical protein AAAB35_25620 [Phyllobacterium sp.]|uniref:hypothetical protein n=1 Tax=Phyllobacterium sp. TaxID=1871046 RepID=UPI0030F29B7C
MSPSASQVETEHRTLHAELREYERLCRKYNADQPRVPAGNSDGGRWTSDGGGSGSIARDKQRPKGRGSTTTFQAVAATASNLAREAQKVGSTIAREIPIRTLPVIRTTVRLLSALKAPDLEYPVDEALQHYNAIAAENDPHTIPLIFGSRPPIH